MGSWQQYYADSQILERKATGPLPAPIDQAQFSSDVPSLKQISNPDYAYFRPNVPDQYRTDIWEQDFKQAEQTGELPNLTIMTLGDDHTGGAPTPAAQVADNYLAVGRIISDISHSQFWKDSAVVVLEDDPRPAPTTSTATVGRCGSPARTPSGASSTATTSRRSTWSKRSSRFTAPSR